MNDGERDVLLARVDERVKGLTETCRTLGKVMDSHLSRHAAIDTANRRMTAMVVVAVISALCSLAAALAR